MHGLEAAKKKCRRGLLIWREENQETSFTKNDARSAFWRTKRYSPSHQGIEEGVPGTGNIVGKDKAVWKVWCGVLCVTRSRSVPVRKVQTIRDRLRRKEWAGQKAKCLGGLAGCVGQALRDLRECGGDVSRGFQYINELLFRLEFKSAHDFLVLYLTDLGVLFAVPPLVRRFFLHPPNTLWHNKA